MLPDKEPEQQGLDHSWRTHGFGKISLARGIHSCPIFFFYFFCLTSTSILWRICVQTQCRDCAWITAPAKYTASVTFLHKSGVVRSVGWICIMVLERFPWHATGRTCDTGQNILQYSFQTKVVAVPVTLTCSFLLHSSRRRLLEIQKFYCALII